MKIPTAYTFFRFCKKFRDSIPNNRKGLIEPQNELIVDVVDKPGIIGEIATILGNNGINIKNINVSNSREFEQGCLRITLPDSGSVAEAYELLAKRVIKCLKFESTKFANKFLSVKFVPQIKASLILMEWGISVLIEQRDSLRGEINIPGDKSISHRAILFGSLAKGTTEIEGLMMGEDCLSTIDCFRKCM